MSDHPSIKSYIPGTSDYVDAHGRTGAHETVVGLATMVPGTTQHHESTTFPSSGMYQGTPAGGMHDKAEGAAKEIVDSVPGGKEHQADKAQDSIQQ